jgi:anti-sigma regulatory factor (Ser/Thr protein kinase)
MQCSVARAPLPVVDSADWPLQSHLSLGALASAVPCARLHTRQVLWEWGVSAFADSAELIVSELVTNGVLASRAAGSPVDLWLSCDRAQLLIMVRDVSREVPALMAPDDGTESGRGLMIVDALASRWGYYLVVHGGKCVWALIT